MEIRLRYFLRSFLQEIFPGNLWPKLTKTNELILTRMARQIEIRIPSNTNRPDSYVLANIFFALFIGIKIRRRMGLSMETAREAWQTAFAGLLSQISPGETGDCSQWWVATLIIDDQNAGNVKEKKIRAFKLRPTRYGSILPAAGGVTQRHAHHNPNRRPDWYHQMILWSGWSAVAALKQSRRRAWVLYKVKHETVCINAGHE